MEFSRTAQAQDPVEPACAETTNGVVRQLKSPTEAIPTFQPSGFKRCSLLESVHYFATANKSF